MPTVSGSISGARGTSRDSDLLSKHSRRHMPAVSPSVPRFGDLFQLSFSEVASLLPRQLFPLCCVYKLQLRSYWQNNYFYTSITDGKNDEDNDSSTKVTELVI